MAFDCKKCGFHHLTAEDARFIREMQKLRTKPGRTPIKPSKRHKDKTKYSRKGKHAGLGKD